MRSPRATRLAALAAAVALAASACSSSGGGGSSSTGSSASGAVNLTWWHNATADPLKTIWQNAADAYHAAHPKVTFTVDPIQNEQFTTKVPLALQSDNPPSIYQQWGGGQEASQVSSGKLMDLTSLTSSWIGELGPAAQGWQVGGKQYGVPFDLHVVGFWYNKQSFTKAGITGTPTTLDQLDADVAKLKAAGIAPIAIGSKDKWPDAFYWDYFAVRECSTATLKKADASLDLSDPCWTKAGQDLKTFLATSPFQTGFLGTASQQGSGSSAGMVADGKAAMELQGDWDPSVMASLSTAPNLQSDLGWFPFPAVPGGQGDPTVALGGGDGFSCTTGATSACADFLQYLDSTPVQEKIAAAGGGLPANGAASGSLTDPTLKQVLQYDQQASYVQMYFDTAFPTAAGQALDAAVADFFAGQGTAQSIVKSITDASSSGGN
jgi:raffinose/stachyose/melibiose transport system substrate-binding protein